MKDGWLEPDDSEYGTVLSRQLAKIGVEMLGYRIDDVCIRVAAHLIGFKYGRIAVFVGRPDFDADPYGSVIRVAQFQIANPHALLEQEMAGEPIVVSREHHESQ
jgi:hypothetical protein